MLGCAAEGAKNQLKGGVSLCCTGVPSKLPGSQLNTLLSKAHALPQCTLVTCGGPWVFSKPHTHHLRLSLPPEQTFP